MANCSTNSNHKMNTEKTMKESLEFGFDEIIQYHVSKGELHSRSEMKIRSFVNDLLKQTESSKNRLIEIIDRLNDRTIKPIDQYGPWPVLQLWRGSGTYGTTVELRNSEINILEENDTAILDMLNGSETISDSLRIKAAKEKHEVKINLDNYPISLLGYYHEYKIDETAFYLAWISYLWQEVEGHRCGISAVAIENNSTRIFSLNDFLNGNFSTFQQSINHAIRNYRINRRKGIIPVQPNTSSSYFPRKLSLVELYLRASQKEYPYNPFENYWRYFEKEGKFTEIVTYEFETSIRSGIINDRISQSAEQVIKHGDCQSAIRHLTQFTNQMIFEGWQEKLRPLNMSFKMREETFDYHIWTRVKSMYQLYSITSKSVDEFEIKHGIKLPRSFYHYIRIFNGRQYNSQDMNFPIDKLYTVHVEKFYTIDELDKISTSLVKKNPNHLWIGELSDERLIGIVVDVNSKLYNRIIISEGENIDTCEYTFDISAKYSQGSPKQPEIFAAEENDSIFLKQRIDEGWDFNKSYKHQTAIRQAAEYNSHEALEVLLEAGARMKTNNHREKTYIYDKRTMDILDRYHRDE